MDYSLIIGVVRRKFEVVSKHAANDAIGCCGGEDDIQKAVNAAVIEGPGTFYFGVIDVLQRWTWKKQLERFAKIYFHRQDPLGISAIAPEIYFDRFMQRAVMDVFEHIDTANETTTRQRRTYSSTDWRVSQVQV